MLMIPLMVIKIVHDYVNDFTLDYVDVPAHGHNNNS